MCDPIFSEIFTIHFKIWSYQSFLDNNKNDHDDADDNDNDNNNNNNNNIIIISMHVSTKQKNISPEMKLLQTPPKVVTKRNPISQFNNHNLCGLTQ